jgi:hypothetical protein
MIHPTWTNTGAGVLLSNTPAKITMPWQTARLLGHVITLKVGMKALPIFEPIQSRGQRFGKLVVGNLLEIKIFTILKI